MCKAAKCLLSGIKSGAGSEPFHRRASHVVSNALVTLPQFKWHIHNNNGSYKGWFDWLPLWMRVGYWSPFAVVFLVVFYTCTFLYVPRPLEFASTEASGLWLTADMLVFLWGVLCLVYASKNMSSFTGFLISYTGWSWFTITARAGLSASASLLEASRPSLATKLASLGSSLQFPALVSAFMTFIIWNFILFPIMYLKAVPSGEPRKKFLKFNFSFCMINFHIFNLPLATINIIYGGGVRLFTESDLWMAYLVVVLYSMLYIFVMDRLGIHFYPIFCPRSATCAISFGSVLYFYYYLMQQGNAFIIHLNPRFVPI